MRRSKQKPTADQFSRGINRSIQCLNKPSLCCPSGGSSSCWNCPSCQRLLGWCLPETCWVTLVTPSWEWTQFSFTWKSQAAGHQVQRRKFKKKNKKNKNTTIGTSDDCQQLRSLFVHKEKVSDKECHLLNHYFFLFLTFLSYYTFIERSPGEQQLLLSEHQHWAGRLWVVCRSWTVLGCHQRFLWKVGRRKITSTFLLKHVDVVRSDELIKCFHLQKQHQLPNGLLVAQLGGSVWVQGSRLPLHPASWRSGVAQHRDCPLGPGYWLVQQHCVECRPTHRSEVLIERTFFFF